MSEDNGKWSCLKCTYLNYTNAIRCTMCTHPKVPPLIVAAGAADIYQLGSQGISDSASHPTSTSPISPTNEKWPCQACTYLNFARSVKCTQCQTPGGSSFVDRMSQLALTNQQPGEAGLLSSSPGSGEGRHSPSSESFAPLRYACKWRCRVCTYENWAKSVRCTMCSIPRNTLIGAQVHPPTRLATPPPPPLPKCDKKSKEDDVCDNKIVNADKTANNDNCKRKESVVERPPLLSVKKNNDDSDSEKSHMHISENVLENAPVNKNVRNRDDLNALNRSRSETPPQQDQPKSVQLDSCELFTNQVIGNSPIPSPPAHRGGEGGAMALNNYEAERLLRQLRRRLRDADWAWLNACIGVVDGTYEPVETYLSGGGDPMRQLSNTDIRILARPSAFDEGHTLVHLAIRFGREDMLAAILARIDGGGSGMKRVPAYVAPDLATDIRRHLATTLRQRKGAFPCHFVTDLATFSLPAEIDDLPAGVQEQLFEELLDRDCQKQLEEDAPIVNWSLEITERLGSRLYALWNRTAGDCLLDSVLQATLGIFDCDNVLRRALSDSLSEAAHLFYPRWKEYERWHARLLNYYVPEGQILEEWAELICLASQPGAALEQLHVFVLSHVLRRPVIVYGVKCVKSFRGEDLGYARFEGVYLPFLWEPSFCWKSPIALGYTRGHFTALVAIEPDNPENLEAGAILDPVESQVVFLPLMTHDAKLLPVHFMTQSEVGCEETLLRQWLEVCVTEGGVLVAQQHLTKKPLNVAQMLEEWLNHYRRQVECAPYQRPSGNNQGYSSDGDSDEE